MLSKENFNADAYAAENSEAMAMGFTPWEHYNLGANEIPYYDQHYFKSNPNATSPEEIAYEASMNPDIQGTAVAQDPEKAEQLYLLKSTNPNEYYKQVGDILQDRINAGYGYNENISSYVNRLESLKQESPAAYYENKLKSLAYQAGWQTGQNTDPSGAYKQIQNLLPEAQKAGLSADQINSLVGTSASNASAQNQQRIANEAASGNFWTENLIGALKVGALGLGAYGLDTALTAGAAAAGGAGGAGGMDAAATSYLGSAPGAFVPAEGFSATLPSAIGAGSAGGMDAAANSYLGSSSGSYVPAEGFSATLPNAGAYVTPELMGPTYGELGVTGVPEGGMGPTYGEMGFTGLNQSEAIAAADAASKGLTLSDIASAANKAKQVYGAGSTIAKLLGGTGATGTTGTTSGINQNQLANLLKGLGSSNQTSSYLGQIKANQNPFTWASPGQTAAAPGTYDVSGSNMANALRKA